MSGTLPKRPGLPPPARRWAIGFADLALLIACTLMLGWRPDGDAGRVTIAAAHARGMVLLEAPVAAMFMPGEAMLSARGRAMLAELHSGDGRTARRELRVGMVAGGRPQRGSARLDAWELAAARTAVIARQIGGTQLTLAAPGTDGRVLITALQ